MLARARKDAKATSKELQENVAAKESQVAQRLVKAERENATVYLQRVPAEADLPPIAPASLVKPVAPADLEAVDDEVRNLFSSVIPDARWGWVPGKEGGPGARGPQGVGYALASEAQGHCSFKQSLLCLLGGTLVWHGPNLACPMPAGHRLH